jgi:hypothetical protein
MTLIADALARYPFRRQGPLESNTDYVRALIAHVESRDFAAAHELRVGRRQADWTTEDVAVHTRITRLPPRAALTPAPSPAWGLVDPSPYMTTEDSLPDRAQRARPAL